MRLLKTDSSIEKTTSGSGSNTPNPYELRGRPTSMADALHSLSDSSRPRSPGGSSTPQGHGQTRCDSDCCKATNTFATNAAHYAPDPLDTVYGTGKGLSKIIGVGLKSPLDFTMALTKGFHNVPRLYGEEVRQVDRITGVQSGLRTAGKEFGRGMFEGITGLVTQPVQGARKEGAAGFLKGFGRGIAGIVVKPAAGAYALPAYAMMGVYKEIQKRFGENVGSYIVAARVAQGYAEWAETDETTKRDIVHAWAACLSEVKGRRGLDQGTEDHGAVKQFVEKRKEKRRLKHIVGKETATYKAAIHADNSLATSDSHLLSAPLPRASTSSSTTPTTMNTSPWSSRSHLAAASGNDSDVELEEAIRLSLKAEEVGAASSGLRGATREDEELRAAIAASLEQMRDVDLAAEADDEMELARAMAESQRNASATASASGSGSGSGSQVVPPGVEDQLALALVESQRHQEAEDERIRKEEETVLEYVRRQSLAEAEFKRRATTGQLGEGGSSSGRG
jgi:hypothetical protein